MAQALDDRVRREPFGQVVLRARPLPVSLDEQRLPLIDWSWRRVVAQEDELTDLDRLSGARRPRLLGVVSQSGGPPEEAVAELTEQLRRLLLSDRSEPASSSTDVPPRLL